jgi:plastocyanin
VTIELLVVAGGVALMGALAWYFFAPRKATHAQIQDGRQVVDITVKGGYSPSLIRVQAGTPVQLRFHRQENSDCTARVVFPDLRKSASLAAFGTTTMDLAIDQPGEYGWACGTNMLHGTVIAEEGGDGDGLRAKAERAETPLASPEQGGDEVVEAARGVEGGILRRGHMKDEEPPVREPGTVPEVAEAHSRRAQRQDSGSPQTATAQRKERLNGPRVSSLLLAGPRTRSSMARPCRLIESGTHRPGLGAGRPACGAVAGRPVADRSRRWLAGSQPREVMRSRHAASQRRQASAQTRQCSCIEAWLSHSSPQALQAAAQASSTARVRLAS